MAIKNQKSQTIKHVEEATVGSKWPAKFVVRGEKQADVEVVCTSALSDYKEFQVVSRGIAIATVKATKKEGVWLPK